jgi:hypothetical protein
MKGKVIGRMNGGHSFEGVVVSKVRHQYPNERRLVYLTTCAFAVRNTITLTKAETRKLVEHLQIALEEGVER